MSRILALLVSVVAAGFFVSPAFADNDPLVRAPTGYIEICKAQGPTTPALIDSFRFTVNHAYTADMTVDTNVVTPATDPVPVGACTLPIPVWAGYVTVHELATMTNEPDHYGGQFNSYDYTAVSAVHTSAPGGPDDMLVSTNLDDHSAVVKVNPGGVNDETVVTFTDDPVQGYVEICKSQTDGAGLAGLSFPFTVYGGNGFKWTGSVTVGACSQPILAPAGHVIAQENGDATYVDSITTIPAGQRTLLGYSLDWGWARVAVPLGGTVSEESIVNFENNASQLKICKLAAFGSEALEGTTFHFTVNGKAVPVVAGTMGDSSHCVIVGSYPAGTAITVTEAPSPGVQVALIAMSDKRPFIQGGNDFTGVTASFVLRSGVTAITYVDQLADPGLLKVCKLGPANEPATSFTVTGPRGVAPKITTGTDTLVVPIGQCAIDPNPLPFAGVQTVTEVAQTGFTVQSAKVEDASLLASPLTGNSIGAFVGHDTTVVTYTNIDPPVAPASTGGSSAASTPVVAAATPVASVTKPAATVPRSAAAVKKTAKLASSRIVGRYVYVRVNGTAAKATIRVTLVGAHGKALKAVLRSVPTNRSVRVPNLKLGPSVHSVKVKVL